MSVKNSFKSLKDIEPGAYIEQPKPLIKYCIWWKIEGSPIERGDMVRTRVPHHELAEMMKVFYKPGTEFRIERIG